MPRTLIIKLGSIGDVLMVLPGVHALHLQGHTIDWACSSTVLPLLRLYPWINPILADEASILKGSSLQKLKALLQLWKKIAGRSYDQVATFYYDPRYRLMALPVRAPRKLILSHADRAFRLLPGRHHTDEYARILLARPDQVNLVPMAPVPPDSFPPTPLPRLAGVARIVLVPAGARNVMRDDALRRWPPEFYSQLASLLLAVRFEGRPMEIVLIGGPDDAWVRPHFASLIQSRQVIDLIGSLALPETLALLNQADVLITHDTGPLHLAGVTSIGIIALFGPTDPRGRLPQRPGTLALWGGEHLPCRPCYDGRDFAQCPLNECMREITPQEVARHVRLMLLNRAQQGQSLPQVLAQPSAEPISPFEPQSNPALVR